MKKLILFFLIIPLIGFSQNCNTYLLNLNDSVGDGWNGNYFSIVDSSGAILFSTTLDSGFTSVDTICLPDDCFTVVCDSGINQSDVLWSFSNLNNITLFSGGAPFLDSVCLPYNCTPSLESFESLPISWTNGVYSGFGQTTNLPWIRNQGSTPTPQTGPPNAFSGNWYMYLECAAFPPGSYATLTAECVDPSAFTNMHFSFAYNMNGLGIGALEVEVSIDGGLNWVNEWTKNGNQGAQWNEAYVDLSHYSSYIMVRVIGVVGIGTQGDIAIDNIRFEDPALGCTDQYASNFDPLAEVNDGSCDYSNCTHMTLTMWDNFGDGWNGNYFILTSSDGSTFFSTTLPQFPNGGFGSESFCIPNDCYTIFCGGGFWQYEVYWELSDTNGVVLRSGGAPYSGNICTPLSYGCTDPNASNYDSNVNYDDGSCLYPPISFSHTISNISCNGQNDGFIDLTVNGGSPPINYQWSNGSTNQDLYNLQPGTYSVVITDSIGQSDSASFNIFEPDSLLTDYVIIDASGVGINDGAIYSFTSGGTLPYDFYWLSSYGNDTTQDFLDIPAGSYTSYILDANGCFNFVSMTVGIDSSSNGCMDPLAFNYDENALVDDGSCVYVGCTDPVADNFFSLATIDDGSCYYCNPPNSSPYMLIADWTTDTKAGISWQNMNDECNMVWKYYVRYRELGTSNWITKSAGVGNGLCNSGLATTTKTLQNLIAGTTYEFKMKAFYCNGSSSSYSSAVQFTTKGDCPAMAYLNVSTFNSNHQKARFNWNTYEPYVFARVVLRVDVPGSSWITAGGFGVYYPTVAVNKFGLIPGESYRAQGRTFCDSNITSYRSSWTSPVYWTQPGAIRLGNGNSINNFDIYPNPTRNNFNISFISSKIQNVRIKITNIIGEEVYLEEKESFIGEYIKQINLEKYDKGVYIVEIESGSDLINKKLILQ